MLPGMNRIRTSPNAHFRGGFAQGLGIALLGSALWFGSGPTPALAQADPPSAGPALQSEQAASLRAAGQPRLQELWDQSKDWADQLRGERQNDPQMGASARADAERAVERGDLYDARWAMRRAVSHGLDDEDAWLEYARLLLQTGANAYDVLFAAMAQASLSPQPSLRAQALELAADALVQADERPPAFLLYLQAIQTQSDPTRLEKAQVLAGEVIRLERWEVYEERDIPRVCFQFSDNLNADAIDAATYVTVAPAAETVQAVRDNELCLDGLEHGRTYGVTLRKGLPSVVEGVVMSRLRDVSVSIPERAPRVAFPGSGYVLPRGSSQMVPLHSINLSEVSVDILRIDDRALLDDLLSHGFSRKLDGWDLTELEQDQGEKVWSGSMEVGGPRNRVAESLVPFSDAVPKAEPGIYALVATPAFGQHSRWEDRATQWIMVTDIGLQTVSGGDGLTVSARSLSSGKPLWGVELKLIARNNDEKATAITDRGGRASFSRGMLTGEGGATPTAIMAYGSGGDYAVLDLTGPAFDLSDRGVSGRATPGPIDAMIYTDRGIYRPGETVQLVTLLRDPAASALENLPLTLSLRRPDGIETTQLRPPEQAPGAYHTAYTLLDAARTGQWTVEARVDPDAPPVMTANFTVEDFVPARLDVRLSADQPALDVLAAAPSPAGVSVQADFLYGAPGADLVVTGEATLRQAANPFPAHKDFAFGLVQEEVSPRRRDLEETRTDATGAATLAVSLDGQPDSTHPLEVLARATVYEPGGRATARTLILPVWHQPLAIGLKPNFEDNTIEVDSAPEISVVALSPAGDPLSGAALAWELIEEISRYTWYRSDGRWRYRRQVEERLVASGSLSTGPDGLTSPDLPVLEGGAYRLEVMDAQGQTASSLRFAAGWWVSANANGETPPDKLSVVAEEGPRAPGDVARLFVKAPFAGEAQIMVATDRVIDVIDIPLPGDGLVVELPVTNAWGVGAYVTVSAYRPGDAGGRGPDRALGVAWVPVNTEDRQLAVALDMPELVRPRQTIEVPLKVTNRHGAVPGEPVFVTLAAVDEGILTLTGFQTPDPVPHFLGKRRLGLDIRDSYGRLIRPAEGQAGQLRSGGDAAGRQAPGLPDKSVKTVALFSGILPTGPDGTVRVPLEIPDFNGRLRLMAVAFGRSSFGAGEADLFVRDPLVAQVTLPRFLSPGDSAKVTVALDNVDGPAGAYALRLSTSADNARFFGTGVLSGTLEEKGRQTLSATLQATALGSETITMSLSGPDGFQRVAEWPITIRPIRPRETRRFAQSLPPGAGFSLTPDVAADLWSADRSVSISATALGSLDVAGLVHSLDRYPYGCLEQTTSRALPMVVLPGVEDILAGSGSLRTDSREGDSDPDVVRARVHDAIRNIANMQLSDGSFGLWSASWPRSDWASAYATEFLLRAAVEGYDVPTFVLDRSLRWLAAEVRNADFSRSRLPFASYAYYLLSKAGMADLGALRYVHDVYGHRLPSVSARAQLAAALALAGDRERAAPLFADLLGSDKILSPSLASATGSEPGAGSAAETGQARLYLTGGYDYGSSLRDRALAITLAVETGMVDPDSLGDLGQQLARDAAAADAQSRLNTQEKAWLLLAAKALVDRDVEASLSMDGLPLTLGFGLSVPITDQALERGVNFRNDATTALDLVVSVDGIPTGDPQPVENGLRLTRTYFDQSGTPITEGKLRQGQVIVVLLEGEITDPALRAHNRDAQLMVVDLLPAGLDIESPSVRGAIRATESDWLPDLSEADYTAARDDRFLAAITRKPREDGRFAVAYVARATAQGSFRRPGVFVEDMYRPEFRAAGPADVLLIEAR